MDRLDILSRSFSKTRSPPKSEVPTHDPPDFENIHSTNVASNIMIMERNELALVKDEDDVTVND